MTLMDAIWIGLGLALLIASVAYWQMVRTDRNRCMSTLTAVPPGGTRMRTFRCDLPTDHDRTGWHVHQKRARRPAGVTWGASMNDRRQYPARWLP